MPEKLRQGHFSEITPHWPEQAKVLIDQGGELVYQGASEAFQKLNIGLPEVFTEKSQIIAPGITVSPHWFLCPPRICDIESPEKFRRALSAYAKKSKDGRKSLLPDFGQISSTLYEVSPVPTTQAFYTLDGEYASLPGVEFADRYGLLEISEEEYGRWHQESWWNWHPTRRIVGYGVTVERQNQTVDFEVSNEATPRLFFMRLRTSHPLRESAGIQLPLETTAYFQDGKLWELWQEGVNGAFFEDPRRLEDIWPYWLTTTEYSASMQDNPPTAQNWEAYLAAVRAGKPVYDPGKPWDPPWERERRVRRMTEREAAFILEQWRRYIYYKSIQVFHFRGYQNDNIFKAELGYKAQFRAVVDGFRARGRDRVFVAQRSEAYRRLSPEETVEALGRFSRSLTG